MTCFRRHFRGACDRGQIGVRALISARMRISVACSISSRSSGGVEGAASS
jgi:hypothetical protein